MELHVQRCAGGLEPADAVVDVALDELLGQPLVLHHRELQKKEAG